MGNFTIQIELQKNNLMKELVLRSLVDKVWKTNSFRTRIL